jgi:hypothetical protein
MPAVIGKLPEREKEENQSESPPYQGTSIEEN